MARRFTMMHHQVVPDDDDPGSPGVAPYGMDYRQAYDETLARIAAAFDAGLAAGIAAEELCAAGRLASGGTSEDLVQRLSSPGRFRH